MIQKEMKERERERKGKGSERNMSGQLATLQI